jgi:hypothetical protein
MDPHKRLQHARLLAGYDSASDAANAMGVPVPTYAAHENGSRDFMRGRGGPIPGQRYAQFFKVNYDWLMTGRGEPRGKPASLDARAQALAPEDQQQLREYLEFLETRGGPKRAAG